MTNPFTISFTDLVSSFSHCYSLATVLAGRCCTVHFICCAVSDITASSSISFQADLKIDLPWKRWRMMLWCRYAPEGSQQHRQGRQWVTGNWLDWYDGLVTTWSHVARAKYLQIVNSCGTMPLFFATVTVSFAMSNYCEEILSTRWWCAHVNLGDYFRHTKPFLAEEISPISTCSCKQQDIRDPLYRMGLRLNNLNTRHAIIISRIS